MKDDRSIKIAVTAMGGQGGGVLAGWIVKLGEQAGFIAQSTSVPGVAQRTGATIYYVELFPEAAAKAAGKTPVLALMPAPGDVDVVIAAEFMEAGRAIMRGLVSERTTLIASSHRDYAISEKIALGDGRQGVDAVREAASKAAGTFIEADMQVAAGEAGAVISAVLFGALAGSGALPISRKVFEETIKAGGRAVEANLRGFDKGYTIVDASADNPAAKISTEARAQTPATAVAPLLERMKSQLPPESHKTVREGLKRCVDFQDVRYAELYLDRLGEIASIDKSHGAGQNCRLTMLAAKHLALWMSYEDAARVAALKTRQSRFARLREDVRAAANQIVTVHEYMHPRVEEACDFFPPFIARPVLKGPRLRRIFKTLLGNGRRVPTTSLRGFLMLRLVAGLRVVRRSGHRYKIEQERIESWLSAVKDAAQTDYSLACEVAALQRLIKGYGETHERSMRSFNRIMAVQDRVRAHSNPALTLVALRDAALKDESDVAFDAALATLSNDIAWEA